MKKLTSNPWNLFRHFRSARRPFRMGAGRHVQPLEERILLSGSGVNPPTVLSTTLDNGTVVVGFSEEMAVTGAGSVLNKANWQIRNNGIDAISAAANITFAFNPSNSQYEARIPVTAPEPGQLFTLFAKESIQGVSGINLDGDGNMTPGGDYFWTPVSNTHVAGTIDNSFGSSDTGISQVNFFATPPFRDNASKIIHTPSTGKYTAVGTTISWDGQTQRSLIALVQYNSDGTLDSTFGGGDGKVTTEFSGKLATAVSMAIDPTVGIVVGGYVRDSGSSTSTFVVLRYDLSGQLISSFGSGGKATISLTVNGQAAHSNPREVAIDTVNNRIILVGSLNAPSQTGIIVALKLNNGQLDTVFNGNGLRVFSGESWTDIGGVICQSDGTVLLAGTKYLRNDQYYGYQYGTGLARLKSNGTLDSTFQGGGHTYIDYSLYVNNGAHKLMARNGLIYVFSTKSYNNNPYYFGVGDATRIAIFRFQMNGKLDSTYGSGGVADSTVRGHVYDVNIDGYGNLISAGAEYFWEYGANLDPVFWNESRLYFTDPMTHTSQVYSSKNRSDYFSSIVILPNNQVLLAGAGENSANGSRDFRVDRLTGTQGNYGEKDYTFGGNSYVFTDLNEVLVPSTNYANAFARQPDGKLVTVGSVWNGDNYDIAVTRLLEDGRLDESFAVGGRLSYSWGGTDDIPTAVAIQADGTILIVANFKNSQYSLPAILQISKEGEIKKAVLDPFASNLRNSFNDVVIQSDGKILVVGTSRAPIIPGQSYAPSNFYILRYDSNLNLDSTFGSSQSGVVIHSIAADDDEATSIGLDSSGRIYLTGWSKASSSSVKSHAIVRLSTNGALDTTFNGTGKHVTSLGSQDAYPTGLVIDSASRIITVSNIKSGSTPAIGLMRFSTSGQLDSTFDGDGKLTSTALSAAAGIAVQADDKLVVVGDYTPYVRIMRLNVNGTLDSTFYSSSVPSPGNTGFVDYRMAQSTNQAAGVIVLPNANIAVLGSADDVANDANSDLSNFAVLMLQGDEAPSVSITSPGQYEQNSPQPLVIKATDPSADDNLGYFAYSLDWNDDGIFDEHFVGMQTTIITHRFPSVGTHFYRVAATDRDGRQGPTVRLSFTVPENDAPVISNFSPAVSYTENSPPILVDDDATIADLRSPDFEGGSLTFSITVNAQSQDLLSIRHQGTGAGQIGVSGNQVLFGNVVIGTFSGGNGSTPLVINLNGDATLAATQALLRNVTFSHGSEDPSLLPRTIQVVLNDGDGMSSSPVSKSVSLIATNDAPILDPSGTPTLDFVTQSMVLGGQNLGTLISDIISRLGPQGGISDVDALNSRGIAINSLSGISNGTWQFSTNGGTSWTNLGTVSDSSSRLLAADALTRVRFVPNPGFKGNTSFTFFAWDRTSGSNGSVANATQRGGTTAFSLNGESVEIAVLNSAPELSTEGSPTLNSIYRNEPNSTNPGTLVSELLVRLAPNGSIVDADTGDLRGIAINGLTGTATGLWQFSIDGGLTWGNVGTTGNSNARLLAANANTRIRYVPNAGFTGEVKIAFTAWDLTSGANGSTANVSSRGGTTPYSLNYEYASLNVISPPLPNAVGIFRSGKFYLDTDANRVWNPNTGSDQLLAFGAVTDTPLVGDWNGDGRTDLGVWRSGKFYLDANGNNRWDNPPGGDLYFAFGATTDLPISGDWNGDGKTEIGAFRDGKFYLDTNGNRRWDGVSGGDHSIGFGTTGDLPVIGDWNGDGRSDIGIIRDGRFYLDANGNRKWDNTSGGDTYFTFGTSGDKPIAGDWNGDGKSDVGVVRSGYFYLDVDGNRKWNTTSDVRFSFGSATDIPLVGLWQFPQISAGPIPASAPVPLVSASSYNSTTCSDLIVSSASVGPRLETMIEPVSISSSSSPTSTTSDSQSDNLGRLRTSISPQQAESTDQIDLKTLDLAFQELELNLV